MPEELSRRRVLTLGSGFTTAALAGCLQLQSTDSESTTGAPTQASTTAAETATQTATPEPVLDSPWTIDNEGSDIITHDGTFYLSTWLSRELVAVSPDGTEQWRGDQKGKFKRKQLTANDSAVAACGYGGQVTLFEQADGTARWNYTDAEYTTWGYVRPYMNDTHLVTVNQGGPDGDQYLILVFDVETGDVVGELPRDTSIAGVALANDRLYVATIDALDIYDTTSFDRVTRISDFDCTTVAFRGTEAIVETQNELIQYTLEQSGIDGTTIMELESSASLHQVTADGLYLRTADGLKRVSRGGDEQWTVDIEASLGPMAVATETVYVIDDQYRLYAIDLASGDLLVTKTLSPDGLPQPRVDTVNETAVVMNKPIQSFRRRPED